MALPTFTMRQMLEAGVLFGHNTRRWNPRMEPYIFGERNKIHILDLQQTMPMFHAALKAIGDVAARGGRVLFVGTKRAASEKIAEAAKGCGQYYVTTAIMACSQTGRLSRSQSADYVNLRSGCRRRDQPVDQERTSEADPRAGKAERTLGGIKEMGGLPDILFVLDTNKESISVQEANRLNIPVVAIVDSNASPDGVDYLVPGNDDAMRAITFYCDLAQAAVLDGLQTELIKSGGDIGAAIEAPVEAAILEPSDEAAIPAVVLAEEASAVEEAPALAGATGEADAAVTAEKIV